MVCCLPFMTCVTLTTIYLASFYLISSGQPHISISISYLVGIFALQQIRSAFLFIVFERIYATVKLEKYRRHNELNVFWFLTMASMSITLFYVLGYVYCKCTQMSGHNRSQLFRSICYWDSSHHRIAESVCIRSSHLHHHFLRNSTHFKQTNVQNFSLSDSLEATIYGSFLHSLFYDTNAKPSDL